MLKFVHMADIHLGYRQYGSEERALDFAQAFLKAVNFAVEKKVDFILIAGDLFHKRSEMDPVTLAQASKVLEKARSARIPVIAVEGNHDSTYFRETYSWMDYLAAHNLLINLKPSFGDGIVVEEWDGQSGAYIDIGDVRIYGMKYYGSMTERILELYIPKIKKRGFTIFTAHVGVEGYMNIYGCIPASRLHRLKGKVDYVALGHIHKSFVEGNFIFNPGSIETCEISEYGLDRGIFYVEYDGELRYKLVKFKGRDFIILNVNLDEEGLEGLKRKLKNFNSKKPVVHIGISCRRDTRKSVNEEKVREVVKAVVDPLVMKISWEVADIFKPVIEDRENIERCVIEQLLQNYRYGDIAEEVLRLKSVFSSSFDIKSVDRFVESILESKEEEREFGKEREKAKGQEKQEEKEKERKQEVQKEPNLDKSVERLESEQEGDQEGEEVWDWRRAYDKRGKARKR
ncbi:MAG: metallophosphoesterase [Archaeoglobales archaeon]|nr:MAG: metallophosphoesterase [Archaeoglobales archaeon]